MSSVRAQARRHWMRYAQEPRHLSMH